MQSTGARIGVGVVAIAIVVVGFIALSGGDDSDDGTTQTTQTTATVATTPDKGDKPDKGDEGGGEPASAIPVIEIAGGEPVGGVQELSFDKGDTIEFEVKSDDTSGEIHFHGYDVSADLEAGGVAEFSFPADIDGIFEVEIEETAVPIAEVTVNP